MSDEDVETIWNEFWGPLIDGALEDDGFELPRPGSWVSSARPDDTVVLDLRAFQQIKRELHDWHFAMTETSVVYCHITGDRLSKPTYDAATVITAADEYYSEGERARIIDAFLDANEDQVDYDGAVEAYMQSLLEALGISLDELVDAARERNRIRALIAKMQERTIETVELPPAPPVPCEKCGGVWQHVESCEYGTGPAS